MQYKYQWKVAATRAEVRKNAAAQAIAEELGILPPTAQLLVNRGCATPEEARSFLAKEEEQLHDPFLMKDMDKAVDRIVQAVEEGEKIVIYGDYDVDGVTSVTCLCLYLESRGAQVSYYIPCRATAFRKPRSESSPTTAVAWSSRSTPASPRWRKRKRRARSAWASS